MVSNSLRKAFSGPIVEAQFGTNKTALGNVTGSALMETQGLLGLGVRWPALMALSESA